ncbi:MAG TPA: LPS export ABC transporter periplasmic protein LptC [Longimicrobiales bacterium]|nr:LPS export ABC transporter periplasmic protein LptC [Longimicrobiales bacterium]
MRKLVFLWLAAVVGSLGVAACDGPTDTPVAAGEILALQADLVQFGMVSFLTASGIREGRVEADTAYAYNDSAKVIIRGMHIVFFNEDGSERASVTADGGELEESTDRMLAQGNVVLIVHADGRKIESSELNYDPNRDRIWSDSATVQTLANGDVTRGTAFESDMEFKNVRIANPRGAIGNIIF